MKVIIVLLPYFMPVPIHCNYWSKAWEDCVHTSYNLRYNLYTHVVSCTYMYFVWMYTRLYTPNNIVCCTLYMGGNHYVNCTWTYTLALHFPQCYAMHTTLYTLHYELYTAVHSCTVYTLFLCTLYILHTLDTAVKWNNCGTYPFICTFMYNVCTNCFT